MPAPSRGVADAEAAGAQWQATAVWHTVSVTVVAETVPQKRPRRAQAPSLPAITRYRVQPSVGSPDPDRPQTARERASTFVLITNLAAAYAAWLTVAGSDSDQVPGDTNTPETFVYLEHLYCSGG